MNHVGKELLELVSCTIQIPRGRHAVLCQLLQRTNLTKLTR
uniref:Uncharacterized protein n=1 Tax=Lotus japonicus TaxID=34305 RepID=I3SCN7_LOTJA|nr:unknown [Lotus japonicus]